MSTTRWTIVENQVTFFWRSAGVRRKDVRGLYPLTFRKLKEILGKRLDMGVHEVGQLNTATVERFLIQHGLRTARTDPALDDQLAGAVYAIGDKGIFFVPSEDGSEARRLFSLAHELGHFMIESYIPYVQLGILQTPELFNRDPIGQPIRNQDGSLSDRSFLEYKANQFAAELLMPRQLVLRIAKRMKGKKRKPVAEEILIDRIVKGCNVSRKAAEYRIRDLEIPVSD